MNAQTKLRYPTQAKIDLAIAAARRAGIDKIGAIEIGGDGTIRVSALTAAKLDPVENEIEAWKARRNRG